VRFPRPRIREQVMDLPEYIRIKKYIMQFLKNNSREVSAGGALPGAGVLVAKPIAAEA
jgi:hypothetical protein